MAVSSVQVTSDGSRLYVKFDFTVQVASLSNSKFQLWRSDGTPVQLADPFRTIDPHVDFNGISRVLTLYLDSALTPSSSYELRVAGLKNAVGIVQPSDIETFTTGASTVPAPEPEPDVVNVVDYSVRTTTILDPETAVIITEGVNSSFFVETTDPQDDIYWVDQDHNNGRITLTFSDPLGAEHVNSTYIKTQRKPLGQRGARWETIAAHITADVTGRRIYVDFPSNAATPLYYSDDEIYFETNYKYRVRVSKNVRSY